MRVEGERRTSAAPAQLWRSLSDPRALGEALPNVDLVDVDGLDRFSASARFATGVGITPLRVRFAVSDRRENEHVRITGSAHGGDHAFDLDVELDVVADGSGSVVRWGVDVRVLGPLRSLGQRALPGLVSDQVAAVLTAAERNGQEQVADRER